MSHSSPGAFAHQREKLLHEESLAKEEKILGSYGCGSTYALLYGCYCTPLNWFRQMGSRVLGCFLANEQPYNSTWNIACLLAIGTTEYVSSDTCQQN